MTGPLVRADGLCKRYPVLGHRGDRTNALWDLLRGRAPRRQVSVLEGIGFEVHPGQSLGIIGENGAGKSTLLKLVTGVLTPSAGHVETRGSVGALLELGAGFHPEYSGRENVRMAAALYGLDDATLATKLPEIEAFADIGEYLDEPVKHYSTGMVVRLGFAVIAAVRPSLLITDEVLSVGDESFQKKCTRWIDDYLESGGTLLLVSHSMYHVQKLCRQAIWLHEGRIAAKGDVFEVTQRYLAWHEGKQRSEDHASLPVQSGGFAIESVNGEDGVILPAITIGQGESLRHEVVVRAPAGEEPVLMCGWVRADGTAVYGMSSEMAGVSGEPLGDGRHRFRLHFDALPLLPGNYLLRTHVLDAEGLRMFCTSEREVIVSGATRELGIARLPHRWLGTGGRPVMLALPTVVVPVFNAVASLDACLASLSRTLPANAVVMIADDASTDPNVEMLARTWCDRSTFAASYVRRPVNLGFPANCNAAFAEAGQADVVLLNSDAIATTGWLQQLARCAASDPRIATITPWSNNAEICSFPRFVEANPLPDDPDRVALAAASQASLDYPELPTAVGFCMFVRRAALDQVGAFDVDTFGRGYGEENDFSLRVAAMGWRNVLCDGAYVAHAGNASFGPLGQGPGGENLRRLLARWPDYNERVARFILADPLRPLRDRLAGHLAELDRGGPQRNLFG